MPLGRALRAGFTLAAKPRRGPMRTSAQPQLPAWLRGVGVYQAVELSNTVIRYGIGPGTRLSFSGLPNRDALIVFGIGGGHTTDSSDNGVDSLDLLADVPAWTSRIAPFATPITGVNYYRTTPTIEPSARHLYSHTIWSPLLNRMIWHNCRSPYGIGGSLTPSASDSLNLDTWAWDAPGTVVESGSNVVQDANGFCYARNGDFSVSEFDSVSNTAPVDLPNFAGEVSHGQMAYDSLRGTFFACAWGDGQGGGTGRRLWLYAARFASQTQITIVGSGAAALNADTEVDCTLFYVAALDAFFYWTGVTLYKIVPTSGTEWTVTVISTTGATFPTLTVAQRQSHSRACFSESLGGMAWLPNDTSNLFFVRLV